MIVICATKNYCRFPLPEFCWMLKLELWTTHRKATPNLFSVECWSSWNLIWRKLIILIKAIPTRATKLCFFYPNAENNFAQWNAIHTYKLLIVGQIREQWNIRSKVLSIKFLFAWRTVWWGPFNLLFAFWMYLYNCNMENLLKKRDDVPRWCVCMSETFDWITLIIGNMLAIINILTLTGCVDSRNILNI